MEIVETCKSAERVSLEGELYKWFTDQGVSHSGAARAVQLLDASTLLAQPRPSRWNRRGEFAVQDRCRYLWYRHAARILGWCERKRFPDIVTGILRGHVFPTLDGRDEATCQDGKGRLSADASAGPIANDAARTAGGSSSVLPHHLAIFGLKWDCGFRVYGNALFLCSVFYREFCQWFAFNDFD